MNWSWKIFSAFGIPVRIHYSMVIIPFIAFSWVPGNDPLSFIIAIALAILLFASVLAHELGHSLTARRYGINTADIVLTPLGGMARMDSIPREPNKEIAISIAGPIVSFLIAGTSYTLIAIEPVAPLVPSIFMIAAGILYQLNLMLGLFNLVPALPMDGGRVFRGVLAIKYGHLKATHIAAKTGKILAIAGGLYGFINHSWSLVFIAFFIYSAAGQEERAAVRQEAYKRDQKSGTPFEHYRVNIPHSTCTRSYQHPANDWSESVNDNITVIKGGKVEIISRHDPEK